MREAVSIVAIFAIVFTGALTMVSTHVSACDYKTCEADFTPNLINSFNCENEECAQTKIVESDNWRCEPSGSLPVNCSDDYEGDVYWEYSGDCNEFGYCLWTLDFTEVDKRCVFTNCE